MPIDDRTTNRSYKLPNAGNFLADDVQRLRDALTAIDADVFARYTKTETDQKLADLINGAPGALDTLNELAAAMGNDPNFAATITNALAGKPGFADVWTRTQADARYVQGITQTENTFTGTGSQTTFALSQTPPTRESLLVTVDGVVQPVSAYTLSGSALILSEAPASGASIRVLMLGVAGPVQSASTLNFSQAGTGSVTRTVESKLREVVSVKDFGAVGDGVANDGPKIQDAINSLPANGGAIYFPSGNYKTNQMLVVAQRNVRLIGENTYNTYIASYGAMSATIQVTGFAFELANFTVYSPSGASGYCVWSTGAGDMYIHDNNLYNGGAINTGYGIYLDDHDPNGAFVAGAYRHRIIRNAISYYSSPFSCGISTAFGITGGGMNACLFKQNHITCNLGISLAAGGGNVLIGNLLQSATGGNSGSRPYTGGVGTGFAFGGEAHAIGNYFERYAQDFMPTSSSARCTIASHTSDASNNIYTNNGGYANPAFAVTGYGVSGEQLDLYPFGGAISANNSQIDSNYRAVSISGNGAAYSGIGIKTSSSTQPGQLFSVWNNSWPLSFSGATLDLSMWGSQLVLGQQGATVNGIQAVGNFATFMYTASGLWRLIDVSTHGPSDGAYSDVLLTGNGEIVPTSSAVVNVSGNGAIRTGTLLAAGKTYGQKLVVIGNSWAATFASGAASWSSAGAPTVGNASGNCMSVQLVYTASGWTEVSRAVRA